MVPVPLVSATPTQLGAAVQALLPWLPYGVLGLAVAQVAVTAAPEPRLAQALAAGLKWSLAAWALLTAARVARDLVSPPVPARGPVSGATSVLRLRASPRHILLFALVLTAAALLRAPPRLVVNLAGLALVAVPVVWMVRRQAGSQTAAAAAAVLLVFAFYPTHLELPAEPKVIKQAPESRFSWSVAIPGAEWRLRQEIELPTARPVTGYRLGVAHAGGLTAPPQVLVRVNDVDAGALREDGDKYLTLDLPTALTDGVAQLVVELRSPVPDPRLRILAQRWTGGATRRGGTSSYFDGGEWFPGTFNDATGLPQHGIYIMDLAPQ